MPTGVDGSMVHEVAHLAELMIGDGEAISASMCRAIFDGVPEYPAMAPPDAVRKACWEQLIDIFTPLTAAADGLRVDTAATVGQARAQSGIPLAAMMDAYKIGMKVLWDALSRFAADNECGGPSTLHAASGLLDAYDRLLRTAVDAHREQMRVQIRAEEQRRAVLVQALIEGALDGTSLWEAADLLSGRARKSFGG